MNPQVKKIIDADMAIAMRKVAKNKELIKKAEASLSLMEGGGKSRYPYKMSEDLFFEEGVQAESQVSFSVPTNADFFVSRISVYPWFRLKEIDDTTNDPSEISYRPCLFSSTEGFMKIFPFMSAPLYMDLRLSFFESFLLNGRQYQRSLQNGPIPSKLFFSDGVNTRAVSQRGTGPIESSEHGNGLYMITPWYLPKGSAVTAKVAPAFAQLFRDPALFADWGNPTKKVEYKVTVVLDGFKRTMV